MTTNVMGTIEVTGDYDKSETTNIRAHVNSIGNLWISKRQYAAAMRRLRLAKGDCLRLTVAERERRGYDFNNIVVCKGRYMEIACDVIC